MSYTAQQQGAMYRNRRRRQSRQILQSLTPWSTGLNVTAGQYVSSEGGTTPWLAQNSGVSGATAPTGTGLKSDGAITWLRVDIQSLLQFLNSGAPMPA